MGVINASSRPSCQFIASINVIRRTNGKKIPRRKMAPFLQDRCLNLIDIKVIIIAPQMSGG
jgi:hypothetical protein